MPRAVAVLDPRGHRVDRVCGCMSLRGLETAKRRQPFEIAPRREDDLDLACIGPRQYLRRRGPEQMDIFGSIDTRLGMIGFYSGQVEMRIEGSGFLEIGAPARERDKRVGVERQAMYVEQRPEGNSFRQVRPQHFGIGVHADGNPSFLDGFTHGGNPRGGVRSVEMRKTCRKFVITRIDPPTGEDHCSTRKHHRCRTFDEQMLRTVRTIAEQDKRGGGDRRTGHICSRSSPVASCNPACDVRPMGIVELLGVASSVSLLAGWRIYLCVFAVGWAMRLGWLDLPDKISSLDVLANPWVLGAAGVGLVAEFLADKVMWFDTMWDAVHTAVRPVGGALLALAIVDPADPRWQAVALLLGGSAALASHAAKAGTRAVVNASPEPVSNIIVSSSEDVATTGLLALTLASPAAAIFVAIAVASGSLYALVKARGILRRLFD